MRYIVGNNVVLSKTPVGPLAAYLGPFAKSLADQGYTQRYIQRQVFLAACFSRWLRQTEGRLPRFTPEQPARYLQRRHRRRRPTQGDRAALNHLLRVSERMQWSEQKRGQLGLRHTPAQRGLRGTCFAQALEQRLTESVDVIGSAVGQGVFDGVPGSFDGVELGSVRGQALQMQPRIFPTEVTQGLRIVNGGAVPHHDDVTAQVTQQVPEEIVDLVLRDVLRMHTEIQSESTSVRADRQAADHRDAIATVVVTMNRSLPDGRPSAPHGRNHHEPGFIDKDDVGTQPRGVFFTCGHRFRFHCSIFSSSRSKARRSGFWQLNPSSCSRRAT